MRCVSSKLDGVEGVGDFGRQKISVLVSDFGGRALEVDVDPLVAFEAVGLLERVGLRSGEGEGRRRSVRTNAVGLVVNGFIPFDSHLCGGAPRTNCRSLAREARS